MRGPEAGRLREWRQRLSAGRGEGHRPGLAPKRGSASRRSLDEIGLETGTDKASSSHDFLEYYESVFSPLRDTEFTLLELGVRDGASMRLWEEYFPKARIIGYDSNARSQDFATERIEIVVGDLSETVRIGKLAKELRPQIIIDDASHRWEHQIATLEAIFPYLAPGGIYVVEDIQTSFGATAAETYGNNDGPTAFEYLRDLAAGLVADTSEVPVRSDFEGYFRRTARSVTFLRHAAIITKRGFAQQVYRRISVADAVSQSHHHAEEQPYQRVPAELVGRTARVMRAWQATTSQNPVPTIPAVSASLRDLTIVGQGLALTSTGEILSETLNCAQNVRRSSDMYRPAPNEVDWVNERPLKPLERFPIEPGVRRVLLKQTWDANFGHWLVDALPKIDLLREIADLTECEIIVNQPTNDAMRKVVVDSLGLAGVSENQIRFLRPADYWFEELTVLGTISRHPLYKSPRAIRFLEEIAEKVEPRGSSRIYLSRNKYPRRQLLNEDEIMPVLLDYGYEILHPEGLSFIEQIAAFRSAEYVVGNMGAAFSSLVFSPPQVSVLALATEAMPHDFFYDIVCHKGGRYRGLQGPAESDRPDMGSNFRVDPDLLAESLAWLHREDQT